MSQFESYIKNDPRPEEKDVELSRKASYATLKKLEKQAGQWAELNASTKKEGDAIFKEKFKQLWAELAVHGTIEFDENGNPVIKNFTDLDGKVSIGILKEAGMPTNNIEYINPGTFKKNKMNIDTGNKHGLEVVEDDDGNVTIIGDHHSDTSGRDTCASKIFYETMLSLGMIERTPALDKLVEFVTQLDNKKFPNEKKYYKESWHTVLGLYRYFNFKSLLRFFQSGHSPTDPLSNAELLDFRLIEPKKKENKSDPIEFKGPALRQRNIIETALTKLGEMKKEGLVVPSQRYGLIAIDIGKKVPSGFDAASHVGCDTYINWSPDTRGFFITSPERGVTDNFKQGKNIRGGMYMKPRSDRSPLTLTLGEVLNKMTDGQLQPTGKLKEFLDIEKTIVYNSDMIEPTPPLNKEAPADIEVFNKRLGDLAVEVTSKSVNRKELDQKMDIVEQAQELAKTNPEEAAILLLGNGLITEAEFDIYKNIKLRPAPQPESTPSPEPASIPEPEPTPEPAQPKPEKPKRSRKKKESKEPSIADLDKEIAEINDKLHSDVIQGWSNVQAMHKRRAELVEKKKKLLGGELPKKEITLEEVGRHIEEARNAARGRNRGLGPMDESPYNSIMPPETTPDGREIGGGEDYWLGIKKKLEAKQNLTEQTTTPTIETQTTPEPSAKRKSKREVKPKKTIQTAEEVVGETKIRLDVTENELAQPEKEKDKPVGPEFKSTLRSYFDKFKDLFRRKEAEVVTPTESVEAEPPTPDKVNLRDRWDMLRTVRVAQMGNWFKERAKSLFIPVGSKDIPIPTIIGGETVQAEQLRRGTKYAAQNVEAYSTLIQNEILVDKKSGQILDSNDAEEIAQEFVAVEKSRGKEFTPEEFSALVEISLKTRIRDNDGTVDRIVGYTIDTLKERLAKARGQATSESVLTEGKLTEIEEQLRTKLNELRNGRITLDAKALTKVMREVLDRKYWARYIYDLTKLLVIGGIIAYKYSGDQTGNVSTTEEFNVDLPLEKKMEWMDHNLWVTSKKLLHEAGVTNPTNAQTQAVDTVLSMANNVKVIDPETGNVIWSQTVNGQIIDRLMQPGLIDAIQASQLAKEIATGVVKI